MSEGYLAGIDLGGTSIKAVLADKRSSILARRSIPTESHDGPGAVIARMAGIVEELVESHRCRTGLPLLALGIGVPGLVDVATGTTRFLPNLSTQWQDIPVGPLLAERLKCPVRLLNDVRMATLGELRCGHGRDRPRVSMAFLSVGTGVGGGIAIDGQLRLGPLGAAGELGHQTILPDGPRCGCGNSGCLEALASGPAISAEGVRLMLSGLAPQLHHIVSGNADRISPREMLAASQAGDERVREALERAATFLGIAAANVVSILHPDLVVLGGGVAELGDLLLNCVRQVIRQRVRMFPTDQVEVRRSLLGDQAGLMGAIALAELAYHEW